MKNFIFSLLLAAMLGGCGDDEATTANAPTPSTTSYIGTISGGAVAPFAPLMSSASPTSSEDLGMWSISLTSAGTFVVTNADGLEASGTYESLDSGFVKLTVSLFNGEAPSEDMIAYGLNVPGLIFFLAPVNQDGSGEIIPMVSSGTCPSSEQSFLWSMAGMVDGGDGMTRSCDGTINAEGLDIVGNATINANTLTVNNKYDICNFDQGTAELGFSCTSGIGTVTNQSTGNLDAIMYLTQGGGAIVKTSPGGAEEKTIVALEGEASLAITDLTGDYAGVLFIEGDGTPGSDSTKPVAATIADGKITVSEWDVETNTAVSDGVSGAIHTFSSNTPGAGFIQGELDVDGDYITLNTHAYVTCQADLNANSSGKNIIICVGQAPDGATPISTQGEGSDDAFSLVLVKK